MPTTMPTPLCLAWFGRGPFATTAQLAKKILVGISYPSRAHATQRGPGRHTGAPTAADQRRAPKIWRFSFIGELIQQHAVAVRARVR